MRSEFSNCWQCSESYEGGNCPICGAPRQKPAPPSERTWNENAKFFGFKDAEDLANAPSMQRIGNGMSLATKRQLDTSAQET